MVSLPIFVIWISAITSSTIANAQSVQSAGLDIDFTRSYSLVWTDKGSGAAADVSFWRPEPASGWFRVGHHVKRGYGNPTEATMVVRARSGAPLARPVDYILVWDDSGSGSAQDASVWRPVCPSGFSSMGDVASGSRVKPALDEVVCVQQSFLGAANPGSEIWNDTGSGAARDFAAWNVVSPAADASFSYFSRGLFFGDASHNRPQPASVGGLWAIRVPKPTIAGSPLPVDPSGGSADQQFWDAIKTSQRVQDYQAYLQNFPNGQFTALARLKIDQLAPSAPTFQPPIASTGSSPDQQFWDAIKASQRVQDYQSYLQNFPNGQFVPLARLKIDQLNQSTMPVTAPSAISQDQIFWDAVKNSQRVSDYQSYLNNFPNGQFVAVARLKIDQLSQSGGTFQPPMNAGNGADQQFWDAVKNSQRVSDFQSYLQSFPNGQFSSLARLKIDQLSVPMAPSVSQNARFLNQLAAENRAKLPLTVGDIQLFDAFSICRSGCQQIGNSESLVIRARTPNLAKQNVSIGQVEQTLKPAMLQGYCGSPEQRNNVTFDIDVADRFNQKIGNFFINARDCGGGTTAAVPPTIPRSQAPLTGFQQVIAAAQPGSINEIARARTFFVVSNDFSIKSKISATLTKEIPQLQPAASEQSADFLIGFELTDRITGQVTANDQSNANLRGELIVFTVVPAIGNRPENIRILFRIKKDRSFGVFSSTPDENAAKDFAKQLAKLII